MAQRSIDETFQAIKPRSRRAPATPVLATGATSGDDLSTVLSQAGQQISQLQAAWQQEAAAIVANTQAIQSNTSAQGSHSVASTVGSAAGGLGSGLGLLAPLISGIAGLFGGSSKPAPLPVYVPPPPVSIDAVLRSQGSTSPGGNSPDTASGSAPAQTSTAPNITVNVSAMDSQSFMDRSADIASAVREAMLNLHPINDVVANL